MSNLPKLRPFSSVEKKPKVLKFDKCRQTVSEKYRETAAKEAKT
jgi:hypothetical protein